MIRNSYMPFAMAILMSASACQSTGGVKHEGDPASPEYVNSSPAKVYIELAQAYSAAGQLAFATENAQKAVRADVRNPQAHAMLAYVKQLGGDRLGAENHYSTARKLSPEDPFVRGLYGMYLCTGGDMVAADQEFSAAAVSPRNSTPWLTYTYAGLCYEQQGDIKKARSRLVTAYDIQPSSPQTLQALARVERKLGNKKSAAKLEQQLR